MRSKVSGGKVGQATRCLQPLRQKEKDSAMIHHVYLSAMALVPAVYHESFESCEG